MEAEMQKTTLPRRIADGLGRASGGLGALILLGSAASMSYGAWLLSHPAGFIVGGGLGIAGVVISEMGRQ